jgi:hypothetical protein
MGSACLQDPREAISGKPAVALREIQAQASLQGTFWEPSPGPHGLALDPGSSPFSGCGQGTQEVGDHEAPGPLELLLQ